MEKALLETNAWRAKDIQGAIFLRVSCLVLAAYRALESKYEKREELLDLIRQWLIELNFRDGAESFLKEGFNISKEHPEKAWENMCDGYLGRVSAKYGQGWEYEQGMCDERRFFINVRKCLFADFFLAHNAQDVLYQLCVTDYVWGDALADYQIHFERPTTLSEGSDACRFQFFKMKEYPKT